MHFEFAVGILVSNTSETARWQECLPPLEAVILHCREHHISPHFEQLGKFVPDLRQVLQEAGVRNFDICSISDRLRSKS